MENSFQTSFIPKKPITSNVSVSVKEPTNFFSLITIFLLVVSILISISLFVYKVFLVKQESALSASLLVNRDSFEKDTINELDLFDKRTTSAKKILSSHMAISSFFTALEDVTIPQVQYTNFDQQVDEKGVVLVTLKGIAQDYKSIVSQSDVFNGPKGAPFKNVLFSNLIKDKNNNVSFNLKFNVNPEILSYEKSVLSEKTNNYVAPTNTLNNTQENTNITDQANPLSGGLNNKTQ